MVRRALPKLAAARATPTAASSRRERKQEFSGGLPPLESDDKRRRAESETTATDAERPATSLKLTTDPDGGSDSDQAARAEVEELNARP